MQIIPSCIEVDVENYSKNHRYKTLFYLMLRLFLLFVSLHEKNQVDSTLMWKYLTW